MDKELIYQFMNGEVDTKYLSEKPQLTVDNEFVSHKECGRLYERVYAAKRRLLRRLRTEEDKDIEEIIGCMSDITRILAYKMYDYAREDDKKV